jgi:hypothetical protein
MNRTPILSALFNVPVLGAVLDFWLGLAVDWVFGQLLQTGEVRSSAYPGPMAT